MAPKTKTFIFTPSLFFQYATCPQWIWFDLYGDQTKKKPTSAFQEMLLEQGVAHEESYVKSLNFVHVQTIDPDDAFKATLKLMKDGVPLIYQGMISAEIDGNTFRGRPDLLEKREGKSSFGDWYYAPVDIKNSSHIKGTHLNQLILYGMILQKLQGVFPAEVAIVNRDKERIPHTITEADKAKTAAQIDAILSIARGKRPPLTYTGTCKQGSPWADECFREAKERDDIALIYNLDSRAIEGLRENGINTVKEFAEADIASLPKINYASPEVLATKQLQAQSLVSQKVIRLKMPELEDAPLKLYFDIEGDPFLNVEYLFGFWVVEDGKESYYKGFVAEQPEDEEKMWNEFLAWLKTLPKKYKVYHYHIYEITKLKLLGSRYGTNPELETFQKNMIDLARIVQTSVILPLYFYSVKDIAKYLKFTWRSAKAGGAQSILWYEEWLEKKDRQILNDVIGYNEDDVKATEVLHKWLMEK